jgi:spore germination protein YaaH
VWVGRVIILDKAGSFIAYWSDAETIVHWRDRARLDYRLSGIALWSLGQEDLRIWDRLRGGELTPETKRLDR